MINHPNRKKTYPDTMLQRLVREAGYQMNPVWEIPGPKNTRVAWLTGYNLNGRMVIVSTFDDRHGGGWEAYTSNDSTGVPATVKDVLARCGVSLT